MVVRLCTKCRAPAIYIACGNHGTCDNLAETERVKLIPFNQWFESSGLRKLNKEQRDKK